MHLMYVAMVSNLSIYSASLMGKLCCSKCVHMTFRATSVLPAICLRTTERSYVLPYFFSIASRKTCPEQTNRSCVRDVHDSMAGTHLEEQLLTDQTKPVRGPVSVWVAGVERSLSRWLKLSASSLSWTSADLVTESSSLAKSTRPASLMRVLRDAIDSSSIEPCGASGAAPTENSTFQQQMVGRNSVQLECHQYPLYATKFNCLKRIYLPDSTMHSRGVDARCC